MENYCNHIIEKYKSKRAIISSNLEQENIFPNRAEPLKKLPQKDEIILKITFCMRVAFLNEFEYLFAFVYSKNTFEQTILNLESQGYIRSNVSKDYGKYWILTKQALYYIYDNQGPFNESSYSEDKFPTPSKLSLHKCLNSLVAQKVFSNLTYNLFEMYSIQSKEFRNKYTKEQFLKYIAFDKPYSKSDIDRYIKATINNIDKDNDLKSKYKAFIKYFKENFNNTLLVFNYLKDYFSNECSKDFRDASPSRTFQEFNNSIDNVFRHHANSFRDILLNSNLVCTNTLKKEYSLYLYDELLKQFSIHKRCLLNKKIESISNDEIEVIAKNVEELETAIENYKKQKECLEENFTTMVFDHFENELPQFKESIITFESLKRENVYVTDVNFIEGEKPTINFVILKPSIENIPYTYIESRLQKIHLLCWKTFCASFNYSIEIVVTSEMEKNLLCEILKTIKTQLCEIQEFRTMDFNNIQVSITLSKFNERYEVFSTIRPLIMNIKKDENL